MAKKLELYEDAGARFEALSRQVLNYKPASKIKPSKRAEQLAKADAKPVSKGLNRA